MSSSLIQISHAQSALLAKHLKASVKHNKALTVEEEDELNILQELFEELKKEEAEHPSVVHAFCL